MPVVDEALDWQRELGTDGARRERSLDQLHAFLLRAAYAEVRRRVARQANITGCEVDDLACQAADDSLMAILTKIDNFRGECRFTTWAYRFVALEVSAKVRRHICSGSVATISSSDWDGLPDLFGLGPADHAEWRGLITAVRRAVETTLSVRQQQVFIALVVDGVAADALGEQLGITRNAIHQVLFDVRRKLRLALESDGYLAPLSTTGPVLTKPGRRRLHG